MKRSKDRRIKKLKRNRILPSLIGLCFLLFLFIILLAVIASFTVVSTLYTKMDQCNANSERIAYAYKNVSEGDIDKTGENVLSYLSFSPDIDTVSILSADEKPLWSSSDRYPDMSSASTFSIRQNGTDYTYYIAVEEDAQNIFEFEDEELAISSDIFDFIKLQSLNKMSETSESFDNISIIEAKLWYIIPSGDYNVCVLNHIHVYAMDFIFILTILGTAVAMLAIFCIYYVISFIFVLADQHKITKIIYTDMVTGGNNWLHFTTHSTKLLKRASKKRKKYAVVHLRMRKYQSFCTCFGVKDGEELLERFYHALRKNIKRKEQVAYRENADFALLLLYEDENTLSERISQIESSICQVLENIKLNFSFGICLPEKGETDVEKLYNNAYIARELLCEDNEKHIAFFDIEMNKQHLWEHKVEDDMEKALLNKEFQVYLQPKISTRGEQLGGAEALVRWIHPTEGFIPPNRFIPIFERNGFILKLDDYMLEEVARKQSEWIAKGRKVVPISVNISRAHFTREDLADHICRIVDKYNVPHDVIELELTESAFFDDKQVLLNTVKQLREHAFPVSMDDFGAGYSSLNSLKELPIDVLKIDADFFRGIDSLDRGMLIVSEVIDLAKKLDMKIVAEGIESREQVDFLIEQECDLIQGYFYAKPMPMDEFEKTYE
ncbi:MAG: EAL domain-containing protein [Lachnospiraceae bacterium]|nr:EAL domain-containing protein [Lachnospiraceae bacterium]